MVSRIIQTINPAIRQQIAGYGLDAEEKPLRIAQKTCKILKTKWKHISISEKTVLH